MVKEEYFQKITLNAGQILFEQGAEPDALYILRSGELGVKMRATETTEEKWLEIDQLHSESVVGEMGILSKQPRTATVYALKDCELDKVSAETYAILTQEDKKAFQLLTDVSQPRWQRIQLAQIITNLFGNMDAAALQDVQAKLKWQHFASGDVLMNKGDVADSMYIIVSGRVQFIDEDGASLGEAGSHETVGEYALLSTGVRSAMVRAVRDTSVAIMTQAVFEELISQYPRLLRNIAQVIVERRQRSIGHLSAETTGTKLAITLLPTHPTTNVAEFAKQLTKALGIYGSSLVLDGAAFEEKSGLSSQTELSSHNNLAVVRWLEEQESQNQHMIYIPDQTWSDWTRRCVSQSDRVILVADRLQSPEINHLEQQLLDLKPHTRRDLVLWHPTETTEPRETAKWLDVRSVKTHYHIRRGDDAHFARMARRLTNRAIGVVLAGGGARGMVHIGVYTALKEAGVPIDYIGGASFGALISAQLAHGIPIEKIKKDGKRIAASKAMFDTTLPMVALYKSSGVSKILNDYFSDARLEDLWIPCFVIAANLNTQEMAILERGLVWKAVRKSVAIPGVFTPVAHEGHLYVDGGVVNNFPTDVMIEMAESNRIVGIRCAPTGGKKYTYDIETSVSGWKVLRRQVSPFSKRMRAPIIADTIMRSLVLNSTARAMENKHLCDLYLNLRPKGYSMLQFTAIREIADFGYENSIEAIREWAAKQDDL